VLASAATVFLVLLQRQLTSNLEGAARQRAADVAALVAAGPLPSVIPSANDETGLVQVVDAGGGVLAASGNVEGEPALADAAVSPGSIVVSTRTGLPVGDAAERYRVVVLGTGSSSAPTRVIVAASLRQADAAVRATAFVLAEGLPVVLAVTALVTWAGVGWALRPIERIRRGVAGIGGGDATARVPVPDTDDEVHRLAVTMNSLLGRMQDATRRQQRFTADASHELRSPLANMGAILEAAAAARDPRLWQETGEELLREHARMTDLVVDLLLLANVDGAVPARDGDVDLEDLVHAEGQRLERLEAAAVTVRPLPTLRVRGDAQRLARAIRNVGDNAVRHAAGAVILSLSRDGQEAVVRIADDGPGIAPSDRERIFDRFTRLDDARARDTGGSGLGLAISREIAQAHGGTLRVADAGPPGAIFELRLPLAT
jgi:signal transduction histidine kinase